MEQLETIADIPQADAIRANGERFAERLEVESQLAMQTKAMSAFSETSGGALVPPPYQARGFRLRRNKPAILSKGLRGKYRKGWFSDCERDDQGHCLPKGEGRQAGTGRAAIQKAAQWLATRWAKLEERYGRRAALSMAAGMIATLPVPGNITAIVAAAEAIRGLHGYFTGSKDFPLLVRGFTKRKSMEYLAKGEGEPCERGETAAKTDCVPASGEAGGKVEKKQNFERWFGDSKIVDVAGKPRVLFRGHPAESHHQYGGEKSGRMIFLTTNERLASQYAAQYPDGRVSKFYVQANHPIDISRESNALWRRFVEETNAPSYATGSTKEGIAVAWTFEREFRKWLDEKGIIYDAIYFAENDRSRSLAVKNPSQLKDAAPSDDADKSLFPHGRHFRKSLTSYPRKESYFATCERDEGGQCVESGQAGSGGKQEEKRPKEKRDKKTPAYVPSVKIKPTKKRAFEGKQVAVKNPLGKQAAGKIGEEVLIAYLQSIGRKDARPMNTDRNNFPIDMLQDHETIEGKTGQAGNSSGAQQWRLTLGEPGKEEKAWLKKASKEEKAKWNAEKQKKIHERKEVERKKLEKELGRPVKAATMTVILNADTKTADLYKFEGWHDRVAWNSDMAKKAYIGSFTYEANQ